MCLRWIQQSGDCGVFVKNPKLHSKFLTYQPREIILVTGEQTCRLGALNVMFSTSQHHWGGPRFHPPSVFCLHVMQTWRTPTDPTQRQQVLICVCARQDANRRESHEAAFLCPGYFKLRTSLAGCLRSVVSRNKRIYSLSSTTICHWHQWVCEHFFHFTLRLMMGSTESSLGVFIFMLRITKVTRRISSPLCCLCWDVISLPTQPPAVQKQCPTSALLILKPQKLPPIRKSGDCCLPRSRAPGPSCFPPTAAQAMIFSSL